ncbi:helix-hairpin-helix domain-containing protein [candidate division KSB1 bacterium]
MQESVLKELQQIPGIGKSISQDLWDIGIRGIHDLRDRDPAELYNRLQVLNGAPVDRCVLYVFRCAVYYAENKKHDPELLKWWNWKDRETA